MSLPNFLIPGVQKCGTTALHHYLRAHPEVFMCPAKEPCFLLTAGRQRPRFDLSYAMPSRRFVTTVEEYASLFAGVRDEKAIGEATADYLCYPEVIDNIRRYTPDVKLVIALRDPVARAYSGYWHRLRSGGIDWVPFERLTELEDMGAPARFGSPQIDILKRSLYYRQIKPFFDAFGASRIHIVLSEQLRESPSGVLRGVFRFLGVDADHAVEEAPPRNAGSVPASRPLHRVLVRAKGVRNLVGGFLPDGRLRRGLIRLTRSVRLWGARPIPPLSPEIRQRLLPLFREDVLQLQDLLGRDLSSWLR